MKKYLPLLLTFFLLMAGCNPVKRTEKMLLGGDYDRAINESLEQIRKGKDKNFNSFAALLADSYQKAVARDLDKIDYLKSQDNPELYADIFETYRGLYNRQEKIRPVLPLPGKKFNLNDYNPPLQEYRIKTSDYLLAKAQDLMKIDKKQAYRDAYEELAYIESINPNYKNVRSLMDESAFKGTNYVLVSFENPSNMLIPRGIKEQLEELPVNKLNRKWTVFDLHPRMDFRYDFTLDVNLSHIDVSPDEYYVERTRFEKQIKDGYTSLKDQDGKIVKDSLGNTIQVERLVAVRCDYTEHHQFKSIHMGAFTRLNYLENRQEINSFSTESEIFFENVYATVRGDRRALESTHLGYLNNRAVPFPTNEQMLYDATEQLKDRLIGQIRNLRAFN